MKTLEIVGNKRETTGKKDTVKLRRKELVPCVLYGSGENINFYAHENAFKRLVFTPDVHLVNLDIEGIKHSSVMKDIQFHPVTDKIIHVDFLRVSEDKKITLEIPVLIQGNSPGVKEGGKLKLEHRRLKVKAFLKDIPEKIIINIDNLQLGKIIKVADLSYENIEIMNPKDAVIVSVKLTRIAKAPEVIEAEKAAAEAEAAKEAASKEAEEAKDTKESKRAKGAKGVKGTKEDKVAKGTKEDKGDSSK
ncbi:MAG: 50S ribosomal protein L25/general stress protein Ctc [Bacteroidia bacterium]|nr:50S ribosomal protein L25/general stress protein Ctc [Bacteroidia bacterium]